MATVHELFVSDTFLVPEKDLVTPNQHEFADVGYFSFMMRNFFLFHGVNRDSRENRLSIFVNDTVGRMTINFDSKYADINTFFSVLEDDLDIKNKFFNVIERAYLTQSSSMQQINEELAANPDTYGGYVEDSLFISGVQVNWDVTFVTDTETIVRTIQIPANISFQFELEDGTIESFKFYFTESGFLTNYSKSIIMGVVLPCEGRYIIDPSLNRTIIDTITNSADFIFDDVDVKLKADDYTGNFTYSTRYKIGPNTFTFMPFGIFYKGRIPSTLAIRDAIRDKLRTVNPDETIWRELLPDLFVVAQFYMIPMFDNYTVRPERTLFPSIINHQHMQDIASRTFPDMTMDYIREHGEIILNGHSEIFTYTLPDPLNEEFFSILAVHPTYTYHLQQSPGWIGMDTATRDFNVRFNQAVYIILGRAPTTSSYVFTEFDGKRWLTFVSGTIEYYLLTEASFPFDVTP